MRILYIAYSCAPNSGSENRIGWCVPLEMAKNNEVFVITKAEHKQVISDFLRLNPVSNIHFEYVDIPYVYKKLFNGFMYSARLNLWHRRAIKVAERICQREEIQIIHQITPVEIRAIGDYGSIKDVYFVAGPLGGGEYIPSGLRDYAKGHYTVEIIRKLMNSWYRFYYKSSGCLKRCDCLIYANAETRTYLGYGTQLQSDIFTDDNMENRKGHTNGTDSMVFLFAGRLIYRKGLSLLFDALEALPEGYDYEVRIVGDGPDKDLLKARWSCSKCLQDHVSWVGRLPFAKMPEEYAKANVLIMPSIRETGGSVMLEAMYHGIPVIAIDRFGSGLLLNDRLGWTFDGQSKQDFISSLANAIQDCICHPEEVAKKGQNMLEAAKKYTCSKKVKEFMVIYDNLLTIKQ